MFGREEDRWIQQPDLAQQSEHPPGEPPKGVLEQILDQAGVAGISGHATQTLAHSEPAEKREPQREQGQRERVSSKEGYSPSWLSKAQTLPSDG